MATATHDEQQGWERHWEVLDRVGLPDYIPDLPWQADVLHRAGVKQQQKQQQQQINRPAGSVPSVRSSAPGSMNGGAGTGRTSPKTPGSPGGGIKGGLHPRVRPGPAKQPLNRTPPPRTSLEAAYNLQLYDTPQQPPQQRPHPFRNQVVTDPSPYDAPGPYAGFLSSSPLSTETANGNGSINGQASPLQSTPTTTGPRVRLAVYNGTDDGSADPDGGGMAPRRTPPAGLPILDLTPTHSTEPPRPAASAGGTAAAAAGEGLSLPSSSAPLTSPIGGVAAPAGTGNAGGGGGGGNKALPSARGASVSFLVPLSVQGKAPQGSTTADGGSTASGEAPANGQNAHAHTSHPHAHPPAARGLMSRMSSMAASRVSRSSYSHSLAVPQSYFQQTHPQHLLSGEVSTISGFAPSRRGSGLPTHGSAGLPAPRDRYRGILERLGRMAAHKGKDRRHRLGAAAAAAGQPHFRRGGTLHRTAASAAAAVSSASEDEGGKSKGAAGGGRMPAKTDSIEGLAAWAAAWSNPIADKNKQLASRQQQQRGQLRELQLRELKRQQQGEGAPELSPRLSRHSSVSAGRLSTPATPREPQPPAGQPQGPGSSSPQGLSPRLARDQQQAQQQPSSQPPPQQSDRDGEQDQDQEQQRRRRHEPTPEEVEEAAARRLSPEELAVWQLTRALNELCRFSCLQAMDRHHRGGSVMEQVEARIRALRRYDKCELGPDGRRVSVLPQPPAEFPLVAAYGYLAATQQDVAGLGQLEGVVASMRKKLQVVVGQDTADLTHAAEEALANMPPDAFETTPPFQPSPPTGGVPHLLAALEPSDDSPSWPLVSDLTAVPITPSAHAAAVGPRRPLSAPWASSSPGRANEQQTHGSTVPHLHLQPEPSRKSTSRTSVPLSSEASAWAAHQYPNLTPQHRTPSYTSVSGGVYGTAAAAAAARLSHNQPGGSGGGSTAGSTGRKGPGLSSAAGLEQAWGLLESLIIQLHDSHGTRLEAHTDVEGVPPPSGSSAKGDGGGHGSKPPPALPAAVAAVLSAAAAGGAADAAAGTEQLMQLIDATVAGEDGEEGEGTEGEGGALAAALVAAAAESVRRNSVRAAVAASLEPKNTEQALYFLAKLSLMMQQDPRLPPDAGFLLAAGVDLLLSEVGWLLALLRTCGGNGSPHLAALAAAVRAYDMQRSYVTTLQAIAQRLEGAAEEAMDRAALAERQVRSLNSQLQRMGHEVRELTMTVAENEREMKKLEARNRLLEDRVSELEGDLGNVETAHNVRSITIDRGQQLADTMLEAHLQRVETRSRGLQVATEGDSSDPRAIPPGLKPSAHQYYPLTPSVSGRSLKGIGRISSRKGAGASGGVSMRSRSRRDRDLDPDSVRQSDLVADTGMWDMGAELAEFGTENGYGEYGSGAEAGHGYGSEPDGSELPRSPVGRALGGRKPPPKKHGKGAAGGGGKKAGQEKSKGRTSPLGKASARAAAAAAGAAAGAAAAAAALAASGAKPSFALSAAAAGMSLTSSSSAAAGATGSPHGLMDLEKLSAAALAKRRLKEDISGGRTVSWRDRLEAPAGPGAAGGGGIAGFAAAATIGGSAAAFAAGNAVAGSPTAAVRPRSALKASMGSHVAQPSPPPNPCPNSTGANLADLDGFGWSRGGGGGGGREVEEEGEEGVYADMKVLDDPALDTAAREFFADVFGPGGQQR